jgi:HSP20 family protein
VVKSAKYHHTSTAIYPGIYQPVFTKEQELVTVRGSKPPVNIIEFPDYYQVEMPAPGFKKEDFFIKTQGSTLIIVVHKRCSNITKDACYRQHGFHCRYIARNIDLPGDADTEFGTAEYNNGVLSIYLYKSGYSMPNCKNFIIVY